MNLADVVEAVPLKTDDQGIIRVGGTRVTLDTIVHAFEQELTAEEIAYQFDVLDLADVSAVIAYYLRHQNEVKRYLQNQEQQAEAVREVIENRFPSRGLRERLLAKRQAGI